MLELIAGRLELEGVELGDYEHEPDGLTIDFVFPDAVPVPLAIEVTRLVSPVEFAGSDAMIRWLSDPLNDLTENEALGEWLLHVEIEADHREIQRLVLEYMRAGFQIRSDGYTSDDLLALDPPDREELVSRYRTAADTGILFLHRREGMDHRISVGGQSSGVRPIVGFTDALRQTIEAKVPQLAQARHLQTHLAVEVLRWEFSSDPTQTAPPSIPSEIDCLWVLHRWDRGSMWPNLWWADLGSTEWATDRV